MKKTIINANKSQLNKIAEDVREICSEGKEAKISVHIGQKKPKFESDYVVWFQKGLWLFYNNEISTSTFKVIVYFFEKLQFSNHIGVDQKTMAEETCLSLPTIKKAMDEMIKIGFVFTYKDAQDARRNVYMLNPQFVWKGKNEERKKKLKFLNTGQLQLFFEPDPKNETGSSLMRPKEFPEKQS